MITHTILGATISRPHSCDKFRTVVRLPRTLFVSLGLKLGEVVALREEKHNDFYLCRAFPLECFGTGLQNDKPFALPCSQTLTIPLESSKQGRTHVLVEEKPGKVLLAHWQASDNHGQTKNPTLNNTSLYVNRYAEYVSCSAQKVPFLLYSFPGLPSNIPITVHKQATLKKSVAYDSCKVIVTSSEQPLTRLSRTTPRKDWDDLHSSLPKSWYGSDVSPLRCNEAAYFAVLSLILSPNQQLHAFGAKPARSLLLSGPPGSGKTSAVRWACGTASVSLTTVAIKDTKVQLAKHKAFRKPFPKVIFLDEIDAICDDDNKAAVLASLIDRCPVTTCIIAATNRPNSLPATLRRQGRFDIEMALHPPNVQQRSSIIEQMMLSESARYHQMSEGKTVGSKEDVRDEDSLSFLVEIIAHSTPGYVGGELAQVLSLVTTNISSTKSKNTNALTATAVQRAVKSIKPVVLKERQAGLRQSVDWSDVGGFDTIKKRLKMAVEWPLRYKSTYERLGLKRPRGILLHGPPGSGKTFLVRAAASAAGVSFLKISGAECFSCYFGETEKRLARSFAAARAASPAILFIDELDAIVGSRAGRGPNSGSGVKERLLCTLLAEMDGVINSSDVIVMAATNRLSDIDQALLRPGRFDDLIEVPNPAAKDVVHVLRACTQSMRLKDGLDLSQIALELRGKSCADIAGLSREAGLAALREAFDSGKGAEEVVISEHHFLINKQ